MNVLAAVLSGFGLAIVAPLVCRLTGRAAGWILALLPLGLAVHFARSAPAVWRGETLLERWPWAPGLGLDLSFRLDGLSLLFALLITGIGALVVVYAGGYLGGHPRLGRFYATLLLFMASMLGLVVADNLILLFIFWELTSVTSYLLIGFDHERAEARHSALQALLVTSGGGLALLAGFVLLAGAGGSYQISVLLAQGDAIRAHGLYLPAMALVLLGAFTKSAQFPFHFWLPAAMEAPTPVSAYLHAATMVKAGVYLLARLSPSLGGTEAWSVALTTTGAVTMLLGAWLALLKTDLKQILAYSTVSVLGVLTFLLGIGTPVAFEALAVYLIAHGLYKGALFLVAGAVDHQTGTRDVERLGALWKAMPLTAGAAIVAAVSMAGLPPLFGFVGKELFYEAGLGAPMLKPVLAIAAVATGALLLAVACLVALRPFFLASTVMLKPPKEAPASLWLGPLLLAAGGLYLGLAPGQAAGAVQSAVWAVSGNTPQVILSLFHGVSAALLLSGLSLAVGLVLYATRHRLNFLAARLPVLTRWGPARGYELALESLNRLAVAQTRILQSGYLRYYLLTIIVTAAGLVGLALAGRTALPRSPLLSDLHWHEALLALMILIATVTTVRSSSRLTAVAALGVVGIGMAVLFALFGAPDLAMTQLVVETLTVILLVLVLYHLPDFSTLTPRAGRYRDSLIAIAVGGLMTALVLASTAVQHAPSIAPYFVENSYRLAQGRNVVNVILTDFRVLDTLGEITVLAVAAMGVYSLLRLRLHGKEDA